MLFYFMLNNQKSDASAIQVFNSPQFGEIRTAGTSEDPLFCLSDVCSVLGLRQGDVKQRLDKGVVSTQPLETAGGIQQANFVNEDGLYDVILDSRKPQAKAFRKWITSEVLPAIRKTGGYIATKQGDTSEEIMARALIIAQNTITRRDERVKLLEKEINAQSAQISNLTPKAEFADCFLSCKGDITIGELANILNQSSLFSKGRNKLREWLRKNGYLIKRGTRKNKPTQKSMSLHLMRIASTLCNTGEKNVFREEVMVTARGQKHFITQFRALLSSKESYEIEW